MYHATDVIAKTFQEKGLKFRTREAGQLSMVEAGFDGKVVQNVIIRFISSDNDNDVSVRSTDIARYPEDKLAMGYKRCNAINHKYRFLKFVMDDNGNVNAQFDFPQETSDECLGMMAREIFIRSMNIIDESYRDIMMDILL